LTPGPVAGAAVSSEPGRLSIGARIASTLNQIGGNDHGAIEGFEALVRWDRPGVGLLLPAGFIPAAETSDLICEIDTWVLNQAAEQPAAWNLGGSRQLTVSVNVSGRHVNTPPIRDDVATALRRNDIDPGQLVLEITETVLVGDDLAVENLGELRRTGVALSLDDFGTGHSSIAQLSRLPVDIVKIDKSYLDTSTRTSREPLRSMVHAAHAFDLPVVAEGVEHPDQLDLLRAIGVESAQGYALGPPMSLVELNDELHEYSASSPGLPTDPRRGPVPAVDVHSRRCGPDGMRRDHRWPVESARGDDLYVSRSMPQNAY
jgi:EAL domain-containing protein (putative c-di-GMP-specific phosphodiesterase class I)